MKFSIFGLKMESFPETCLALSYFPELTLSDATESGETCSLNNTKTLSAFPLFILSQGGATFLCLKQ